MKRGGWAGLMAAVVVVGCGCLSDLSAPLVRYEFQRPEMGLPFRLLLYAPTAAAATNAAEAAFARISQLNGELSDYEAESELSRLSRTSGTGRWVPLSDDLARVLRAAETVSRRSDGAFDVTVGPIVQLWRRARRQRELPPAEPLAAARAATGWSYLLLRRAGPSWEAQLTQPGMRLDLGGIAKGFALDEAARRLRALGVKRFLISGGGDLVVGDPPPGEAGWRIEVGVFDTTNAPAPRFVALRKAALATSGDVFQRVDIDGIRYSHIVDPRTGVGLTDHSLVTIIAADGMTADAWSKVVSVLGPGRGLVLVQEADAEALVMRRPAAVIEEAATPGFWRNRAPDTPIKP